MMHFHIATRHFIIAAMLIAAASLFSPMLKERLSLREIFAREGIHLNSKSIDDGERTIVIVTASNPS